MFLRKLSCISVLITHEKTQVCSLTGRGEDSADWYWLNWASGINSTEYWYRTLQSNKAEACKFWWSGGAGLPVIV